MNFHCYLLADGTGKCWQNGEMWHDAQGNLIAPSIDSAAVFSADWDGNAPYLSNIVGTLPATGMIFGGWPSIDQATWIAQNPVI